MHNNKEKTQITKRQERRDVRVHNPPTAQAWPWGSHFLCRPCLFCLDLKKKITCSSSFFKKL